LGEALEANVATFKDIQDEELINYDVVIVTSGTYAGKMPLVGFLKKHWDILQHKKVIVIAVGIAPAEDEYSIKSYELIPPEIRHKIKYFKVPGNMFSLKPAGKPSKEKLERVISLIHGS